MGGHLGAFLALTGAADLRSLDGHHRRLWDPPSASQVADTALRNVALAAVAGLAADRP
ncbi:MAG TPA: hypothetical protein VFP61_11695 [Acidimicrobiales bacterium]|nr:hypothetical protein [Acidimicrobiales bacterium]